MYPKVHTTNKKTAMFRIRGTISGGSGLQPELYDVVTKITQAIMVFPAVREASQVWLYCHLRNQVS